MKVCLGAHDICKRVLVQLERCDKIFHDHLDKQERVADPNDNHPPFKLQKRELNKLSKYINFMIFTWSSATRNVCRWHSLVKFRTCSDKHSIVDPCLWSLYKLAYNMTT